MPLKAGKAQSKGQAEAPPELPPKDSKKHLHHQTSTGDLQGRQISSTATAEADPHKDGRSAHKATSEVAEDLFAALPPSVSAALTLAISSDDSPVSQPGINSSVDESSHSAERKAAATPPGEFRSLAITSSSDEHVRSLTRSQSPKNKASPTNEVSKEAGEVFVIDTPITDKFYEQFNTEMLQVCRISSLIGLVLRGQTEGGGKMNNRGHYFAPDSLSDAKVESYYGMGKYLPDSLTRGVIDGKRSDLFFFRYSIHYLRTLYPDSQNEKMRDIWSAVKTGIEKLKREYTPEAGIKIDKEIADRWNLHEWTPKWTKEMTYGQMFNAWQTTVEGYINDVGLGRELTQHKGPSAEYLDLVEKIRDVSVNEEADNEEAESPAAKLLRARTRIFSETVLSGSIPTNLNPIADQVRNYWTIDKIHKKVKQAEKIGVCSNPVEKQARLKYLAEKLDKRAFGYTQIIRQNLNGLLSMY